MKKTFSIFLMLFFLLSCDVKDDVSFLLDNYKTKPALAQVEDIKSLSNGDTKEKKGFKYHVDYPIYKNGLLSDSIHYYFDELIKLKKEEFIDTDLDIINYFPELHASFSEYEGGNIKSVVYNIFENITKETEKKYFKVFYLNSSGEELFISDIFSLSNENKAGLVEFLYNKFRLFKLTSIDNEQLKYILTEYIENMSIYIDGDKLIFLFPDGIIPENFSETLNIIVDIEEVKNFLNLNKIKINSKVIDNNSVLEESSQEKLEREIREGTYIPEKISKYPKDKKYIALSFDDGPSNYTTGKLLDILDENNVKATFFVLGKNASYFPNILKDIDSRGHEIGNHSWDHPKLPRLDEENIRKQLSDTDNTIYNSIGKTPKLLRPPYGEYNEATNLIADRTIVIWNVDSLDWKNRNIESNVNIVKRDTLEGSIILMHDIHKETIDSIDIIIKALKEEGFYFLTISELLNHYQGDDFYGKVCYSGLMCK